MRCPIFLIIFLTVSLSRTYAASPHDSLPLSVLEKNLETFVVTGNYTPTGLAKSILPVRVLNLEKLQMLGIQNAADALKFSANLRFSEDNVLGTAVSLQGLSGENIKILINGVPQNGRLNGNFDLSQINIAHVERIEIIEGPTSVLYGTNAIAGTINIIMKKNLGKTVGFQGSIYTESPFRLNLNAALSLKNDDHSVILSGGRNFFGGWSATESGRFRDWKPKIQYFANGQYALTVGKAQLGYQINFLDEFILNRGRPLMPYEETAFDDTYQTQRINHVISGQKTFNSDRLGLLAGNIFVSHNLYTRTKNTYFRNLVSTEQTLTANPADQDTSTFRLLSARGTLAQLSGKKANFELGFDVNVEQGTGERLRENKQNIGDYAIFASAEWQITGGVSLRPGLRLLHNTAFNAPLISNLNVRWSLNNHATLRASYGRGFRAPNLKELHLYFVDINHNVQGNANLKAETSHSANVFYNYKKSLTANKIVKFEASGFYNDVKNLIGLAVVGKPTSGTVNEFTYVNINRVNSLGGQGFAEYINGGFSIGAGGGYTHLINQFSTTAEKNMVGYTWEVRANAAYFFEKIGLSGNLWYKHNGRQTGYAQSENGDVLPTFLAGFDMFDAGFEKKMFKQRFNLSVGIKNIFDIQNIQSQLVSGAHGSNNGTSSLATGRNFFIKCEYSL